jgi:hypothetical protein
MSNVEFPGKDVQGRLFFKDGFELQDGEWIYCSPGDGCYCYEVMFLRFEGNLHGPVVTELDR